MKKLLLLAAAAGTALIASAPAQAREGCGAGYHRGPHGGCRINRGPGYARPPVRIVVGNYYQGRGYWDGHRYWQHRYRHHNGWRYR